MKKIPFALTRPYLTEPLQNIESRFQRGIQFRKKDGDSAIYMDSSDPGAFAELMHKTDSEEAQSGTCTAMGTICHMKKVPLPEFQGLPREVVKHIKGVQKGGFTAVTHAVHGIDEVFAALHAEMPWMRQATEVLLHDTRLRGKPSGFRPTLIVGLPGINKTHFASR